MSDGSRADTPTAYAPLWIGFGAAVLPVFVFLCMPRGSPRPILPLALLFSPIMATLVVNLLQLKSKSVSVIDVTLAVWAVLFISAPLVLIVAPLVPILVLGAAFWGHVGGAGIVAQPPSSSWPRGDLLGVGEDGTVTASRNWGAVEQRDAPDEAGASDGASQVIAVLDGQTGLARLEIQHVALDEARSHRPQQPAHRCSNCWCHVSMGCNSQ